LNPKQINVHNGVLIIDSFHKMPKLSLSLFREGIFWVKFYPELTVSNEVVEESLLEFCVLEGKADVSENSDGGDIYAVFGAKFCYQEEEHLEELLVPLEI